MSILADQSLVNSRRYWRNLPIGRYFLLAPVVEALTYLQTAPVVEALTYLQISAPVVDALTHLQISAPVVEALTGGVPVQKKKLFDIFMQ